MCCNACNFFIFHTSPIRAPKCFLWIRSVSAYYVTMGSGSATGNFFEVRLVHSSLKYFFLFQLWYCWIQIYTTKYSNLLLIILILVWIVCSTYRKGEILMQKWHVTSQFVYCYLVLHAILSGTPTPLISVHHTVHLHCLIPNACVWGAKK